MTLRTAISPNSFPARIKKTYSALVQAGEVRRGNINAPVSRDRISGRA